MYSFLALLQILWVTSVGFHSPPLQGGEGEVEGPDSRSDRSSSTPPRFAATSPVWCRSPSRLSACPRLARGLGLYPTYPLTKGRDDWREASRKPGHFSHGEKSTTLFSREPFRKLLTKIYPLTWEKTLFFEFLTYSIHAT